jgi:hypothetical protein
VPLHWRPVGPHPAATYWWRRAGLAAVVVVVAAAVLALSGPGGSGPDRLAASPRPSSSSSGSPSAAPSASGSATPSASASGAACANDSLAVETKTDAGTYAAGAKAVLTLTVKNTGTTPCRRSLGTSAVELLITSGADRIWSSADCSPGGSAGDVVLPPGGTKTATVTWPGTRSAPGCPSARPTAQPGTYRITTRVGDLHVPGPSFQVGG